MRAEVRFGLMASAALLLGSFGAESYARLMLPYYEWVDRVIATGYPWEVRSLEIAPNDQAPGRSIKLVGEVRRHVEDARPAARVVARVQVGEAVAAPVIFWMILLLWKASSHRQRWAGFALGLPVFLLVEGLTTAVQLIHALPEASALLAGDVDPITPWERWSRFLEAGGQFVVIVFAALSTIALTRRWVPSPPADLISGAQPALEI